MAALALTACTSAPGSSPGGAGAGSSASSGTGASGTGARGTGASGTGASGTGASGAGSSGSASGSQIAQGAPILIEGFGSIQIAGETGADTGIEARIKRLDAAGGIDGHQVQFGKLFDDGGSPTTMLQDIQTMVLRDHVFAIFDAGSVVLDSGAQEFAAAHDTPIFGYAFLATSCGDSWLFSMIGGGCWVGAPKAGDNSGILGVDRGFLQATHQAAASLRVAILWQNSPTQAADTEAQEQTWKQLGAQVVYANDSIPQTPPNSYVPYAQQVLATRPNVILDAIPYAQELGFDQAAQASGYTGDFLADSGVPGDLFTEKSSAAATLDGSYQASFWPNSLDNSPASNTEVSDLKAVNGYTGFFSYGDSVGYWSADQFIAMIQAAAKAGSLSPSGVEQVVASGFVYHGPRGYIGSQTWPQAENEATASCAGVLKVDTAAKAFKLALPFTCSPVMSLATIPGLVK